MSTDDNLNLKPCPFCGRGQAGHYYSFNQVACLFCCATGPVGDPEGEKWNAAERTVSPTPPQPEGENDVD